MKFTSRAAWGRRHEPIALKEYQSAIKGSHENLKTRKRGLIINLRYPHFGASPDAIVECAGCGVGCVEITCPLSLCDKSKEEMEAGSACLVLEDGDYTLDKNHEYYYQVQMQLHVSNLPYCDFVMWTPTVLWIERVSMNEAFWKEHSETATTFLYVAVLPELVLY